MTLSARAPTVDLGLGGITRLVNICGTGVAMQMVMTAEPIDAERALACNLVMSVVPPDQLLEEAERIAAQVLRNSQRDSCLDPAEAKELLQQFYERIDAGRPQS